MARAPGWKRLWRHSYRLGVRWLIRDAKRGLPARKVGLARLLVPLDPWRYYELGRVADQEFHGRCLDVSSPKLLPSLLQAEGQGDWLCIDLFAAEIDAWRRIDPDLEYDVQDATSLPYPDETFDCCACISVLEHIGPERDAAALAELWRVLKPGGVLHLTTDISVEPKDVFVGEKIYGQASELAGEQGVFFKHDYAVEDIDRLTSGRPWQVDLREFAAQKNPEIERRFYARVPWSYVYGPLLRFSCANNFETSSTPDVIAATGSGVVYLRLVKQPALSP
jgi:SAM-dependent methyltransferase